MSEFPEPPTKEQQREFVRYARLRAIEKGEYQIAVKEAASLLVEADSNTALSCSQGSQPVEGALSPERSPVEGALSPELSPVENQGMLPEEGDCIPTSHAADCVGIAADGLDLDLDLVDDSGEVRFDDSDAYTGCFEYEAADEAVDDPGDAVFDESDTYTGCFESDSEVEENSTQSEVASGGSDIVPETRLASHESIEEVEVPNGCSEKSLDSETAAANGIIKADSPSALEGVHSDSVPALVSGDDSEEPVGETSMNFEDDEISCRICKVISTWLS